MRTTRREFLGAAAAIPFVHLQGQEKRYRACIIGHTGKGNYGHDLDLSFRKIPRVTVAAVADPVVQGRTGAMERTGAPRGFSDWREMIQHEKPDLVVVSPRHVVQRLEMVTAAAEVGAHAFVEKPFAQSLEEADAMLAIAAKHKVKLAVSHSIRLHPNILHAKKAVEDGVIGDLLEVRTRGKEDHRAGGEDWMVHGPHVLSLMRLFAGEPLWCSGRVTVKGRDATKEDRREAGEPVGWVAGDNLRAEYAFPGARHGFHASQSAGAPVTERFQVALYGTKGVIIIHISFDPAIVHLTDPLWSSGKSKVEWKPLAGLPLAEPWKAEDAARRIAEDLLRSVETGEPSAVDGNEALRTLEMIHAVYASHLSGARATFPLKDRRHPLA
jgi:predicted dehydrogenase